MPQWSVQCLLVYCSPLLYLQEASSMSQWSVLCLHRVCGHRFTSIILAILNASMEYTLLLTSMSFTSFIPACGYYTYLNPSLLCAMTIINDCIVPPVLRFVPPPYRLIAAVYICYAWFVVLWCTPKKRKEASTIIHQMMNRTRRDARGSTLI